jgi:hypothetical protein
MPVPDLTANTGDFFEKEKQPAQIRQYFYFQF